MVMTKTAAQPADESPPASVLYAVRDAALAYLFRLGVPAEITVLVRQSLWAELLKEVDAVPFRSWPS